MIRTKTRISTMLAVGVLALAGCTGGEEEPAAAPSAEETAPSDGGSGSSYATEATDEDEGTDEDEEAAECKADDSEQDIPADAPTVDAWPQVNGIGVPVSDTFGPINRDGDVWTCFAHSPTGALFAAAYIRPLTGMPAVRGEYISDDPALEEGTTDANGVQLRGYKFTAYDESSVSLELVYEASTGGESGLVAFPVTVYWESDQWVVHRSDLESSDPKSVTGLTGYTQWSVGS